MRTGRLVPLCLVLGCAGFPGPSFRGRELPDPWPRPSFTLRNADSLPVDFRALTRGHPTLLLFGYSRCPDVCPGTVSRIAAVAGSLDSADRQRLKVVFVATDEEDTPTRLARWLARFDRSFTGLSGTAVEVAAAAAAAFVPLGPSGSEHYVNVLGIGADDSVRVLLEPAATAADWRYDIEVLVRWFAGPTGFARKEE